MTMNTTLVINAKGGVGKSTITTNLASYFAARDIPTTIADFDPQGSSLNWLAQRSSDARKIYGADLSSRIGGGFANGRRAIPRDTRQLIIDAPAGPSDLERGLAHIRAMDGGFDPRALAETASDVFFKVQGAWTARSMAGVTTLLTPEMATALQRDCDRLRAERKINRLENIAVRSAEVSEAWQESGQDFVTVHFLASLLDYTTDESGGQVLEGSRTEPVKFEEYWRSCARSARTPFASARSCGRGRP